MENAGGIFFEGKSRNNCNDSKLFRNSYYGKRSVNRSRNNPRSKNGRNEFSRNFGSNEGAVYAERFAKYQRSKSNADLSARIRARKKSIHRFGWSRHG